MPGKFDSKDIIFAIIFQMVISKSNQTKFIYTYDL